MCGLVGFFNYKSQNHSSVLKKMNDSLAHRGPDGDGTFIEDSVALAHRRLAIIDLNTGQQPMFSHDDRFVTVFNGEIYNYKELKQKLLGQGAVFRTDSDTEVIAEHLRFAGIEKTVLALRGMFAFAIYDRTEKKLFVARDRTGIKPLYYSEFNSSLFFASEQKALLTVPGISKISKQVDYSALNDVFTLGFPVSYDTCWQAVKMFPPGSYAVVRENSTMEPIRYWQWSYQPVDISFDDALEKVEAVLQDSLKYHIRSDVPLAAFLSGGIDSSLLVSVLAGSGLVDGLRTFNVGFDEKKYDESDDALHVADKAGTIHSSLVMNSGEGNPELFETIMSGFDEPYGDSSCLPTYMICREMRKHVKVVLSGDGGDELFGGYDRFVNVARIARLSKIPGKSLFKFFLNAFRPVLGDERFRKLNNALTMSKCSYPELFCMLHTYFKDDEKKSVYSKFFINKLLEPRSATWRRMEKFVLLSDNGIGADLMGTELALNLHADYLRKVDISSSAHGLEVRVPFLDNEVIDFAANLPMNLKVKSGTLKYLLRELARKRISDRIADKGKWGFGIPFDNWCGKKMKKYLKELFFSQEADNGIWNLFEKHHGEVLWKQFEDTSAISHSSISRFQIYQRIFILASIQVWFRTYNPEF